jgi:hypothetical protein
MTVGLGIVRGDQNYMPNAPGTYGGLSLWGPRRKVPMAQQILDMLHGHGHGQSGAPGNTFPHPGTPVPHPNDFPNLPYSPIPRDRTPNFPHPGQPVPPANDFPHGPIYVPRPHRRPPIYPRPTGINPMSYAAYQRLIGQY